MILEIEGRRIEIDDAFANLSPEEQASTVDEIARQMGITAAQQPEQQPEPQAPANRYGERSQAGSFGMGAAQGVTFGFGDEIGAAIGGLIESMGGPETFAEAYKRNRGNIRQMLDEAEAQNPGSFLGGEIAGGLATAAVPGGAVARGASLGGKMLRGAAAGGIAGGVAGAGAAPEMSDVPAYAGSGAATGAAVGGALAPVASGVSKAVADGTALRQAAKNAPTTDALKQTTNKLFDQLRNSGVTYNPNAYGKMVSDLQSQLVKQGFRTANAPKAHSLVEEMMQEASMGRAPDFSDIQSLRQVAGNMVRTADSSEKAAAAVVRDAIDEFERAAPLFNAGNMPRGEFNRLRGRAREMSLRTIKQRTLDDIMEKAEAVQAGLDSGIRNQLGSLLRSEKGRKLFKGVERQALLDVSQGTLTRNAARTLGKFGFDVGRLNGNAAFIPTVSGAGAFAAGEPIVGGALVAAGTAAKALSPRLTKRSFEQAQKVIRSGKADMASKASKKRKKSVETGVNAGLLSSGITLPNTPLFAGTVRPVEPAR